MDTCADGNILEELLRLLKLEVIEENIFRGQSQDLGFGSVFGGQVLGQTLSAASQTVPDNRYAHSLHGYFLRPGDASRSIIYEVDCIRDDWLLYEMVSPSASRGRGLVRGRIFTQNGLLIASVNQEGLIRFCGDKNSAQLR